MEEAMEVVEMATNSNPSQNLFITILVVLAAIVFVGEIITKFN